MPTICGGTCDRGIGEPLEKDKYEELYRINKAMTEWIGTNMDKLSIS